MSILRAAGPTGTSWEKQPYRSLLREGATTNESSPHMGNGIDPGCLSAAERLDEIADILAAGLIRLRARKSSQISAHHGESSLDFSPDQRGHVSVQNSVGDAS